ncbi:hypothetical protein BDV19DRAFT_81845 [Aspergillus venezuelensis]
MLFTPVTLLGLAALTAGAGVSADGQQDGRKPVAIRKMSGDSGEKFYMHYFRFEDEVEYGANSTSTRKPQSATSTSPAIQRGSDNNRRSSYTSTSQLQFLPRTYPPQSPHAFSLERLATLRSSPLQRRDFECPSGTNACTSINRPDSCCGTDETCVTVEDTGSGDVGCCPAGQDCSGTIGACWTGYTSCSSELGGGCCFPGYECVEEGCSHVVTVTLTLSSTTLTTTSTETVAPTSTSSSSTESSTESSTTTTESESTSTSSSSTTDLSPPDRPTSASTTTSSESETETSCPTGFYACAAVYQGGCCQTGRDCDTTSCPVMSSSTFVSDGRTIVIAEPTDAPSADEGSDSDDSNRDGSGTSQCATGWFSCADTVGGGCCPTGYACGASCTAVPTASTTGTVAKEAPTVESIGSGLDRCWMGLLCAMLMLTIL